MKSKLVSTLLILSVIITNHTVIAQSQDSLIIQKTDELMNLLTTKRNNNDWDVAWFKDCHSDIFSVLNNLELPPKHKLNIDLPNKEGLGDVSHIWVADNNGKRDDNYLKYVKLKNISEESCWEWFLIYYMKNMLPCFWHGGYKIYDLIYSEKQWDITLDNLKLSVVSDSIYENEEIEWGKISETEYNQIVKTKKTPARVKLNDAKNKAEVFFYDWNDWEGLIYNQYELKINDDNTVEVANSKRETIVEYDCGILF